MQKQTNQDIAIAVLKTEMESVSKHIDKLEVQLEDGFEAVHKKLDDIVKQNEERYASKWVERVLIWGGSIIGGILITALMALLIRPGLLK